MIDQTKVHHGRVGTHQFPPNYQSLKDKKILITGAAGFIGGALFNRIAGYGLRPTATVLYPEELALFRARDQEAVILDLTSDDPWDPILEEIDIVFHIAAMFQEIGSSRQAYEKANHHGALKLARTAARAGVERFVHCSTVGVYGNVKEVPATETSPFNPMDEYHETKLAGELAILEWGRSIPMDGMVVVVNRPAMVYGPGDMRLLKLFKAILSKKFLMIGSGETLAHLGYIEDQVESFLLCAVAPRENVHLQAFNIASGDPMTLSKFCQQIADIGGVPLSKHKVPIAPVWLAGLLCEIVCKPLGIKPPLCRRRVGFFTHNRAFEYSKAQKNLRYQPVWGSRAGIAETIRWYRENNLL